MPAHSITLPLIYSNIHEFHDAIDELREEGGGGRDYTEIVLETSKCEGRSHAGFPVLLQTLRAL